MIKMSNKSPIFQIPQPDQQLRNYDFEPPQINFSQSQFFGEERKYKRQTSRSTHPIHLKLKKLISKDDSKKTHKPMNKKKRWWKTPTHFFKHKWIQIHHHRHVDSSDNGRHARARPCRPPISAPVYFTESRSESTTHCRATGRRSYRTTAQARNDGVEVEIPYLSLRELNMEQQHRRSISTIPIYLVT